MLVVIGRYRWREVVVVAVTLGLGLVQLVLSDENEDENDVLLRLVLPMQLGRPVLTFHERALGGLMRGMRWFEKERLFTFIYMVFRWMTVVSDPFSQFVGFYFPFS
jgi:hypothetical protein